MKLAAIAASAARIFQHLIATISFKSALSTSTLHNEPGQLHRGLSNSLGIPPELMGEVPAVRSGELAGSRTTLEPKYAFFL